MFLHIGYANRDKRYIEKNPKWAHKNVNVEIFSNCSLTDPIFIVDSDTIESTTNYCYCNDFARYYYIEDISIDGQIAYLKCHVDVLMSYQSNILSLKANIARCEQATANGKEGYNPLYADTKVLTTVKRRVHYYDCGSTPFSTTGTGQPVVLTVSGGAS